MTDYDRDLPEASSPTEKLPTHMHSGRQWSSPSHPSAPGYPLPERPIVGLGNSGNSRTRRTVGLLGASVAGASLLVIGLGGGYLIGESGDAAPPSMAHLAVVGQPQASAAPSATAGPGSAAVPSASTDGSVVAPTESGLASSATSLGAAVGTVSSISGASFTVQGLDGVSCQVTTTNNTRVATLRGTGGVRNLSVGDPVFVKGSGGSDGVIVADLVIAGAFPDLGAGTP